MPIENVKFDAGYAFAQQESAALSGMAETPEDSPWQDYPDFIRGYDAFHEEYAPRSTRHD